MISFSFAIKKIFMHYSGHDNQLFCCLEKAFFDVCKEMDNFFQQVMPGKTINSHFLTAMRAKFICDLSVAV